jgi:alpha-beta hydrolase superfamily lysophospholipase
VAGVTGLAGAVAAAVVVVAFARAIVVPSRGSLSAVRILQANTGAGTITLSAHPEAVVPGRYGLRFARDSGHLKLGAILQRTAGKVTRELVAIDTGSPREGMRGRISGIYYLSPAELDVEFSEVYIPTPVGPAPAWLVPPAETAGTHGDSWVIHVHGRGVDRAEGLRAVPVFREAGHTSLLISYRNDGVAPPSDDGRYGLGDVEWLDVEAAIRFAIDRGASDVILMGWSMGGATVLQAVTRSRLAHFVRGLILESPVIDWVDVLTHQARIRKIPRMARSVIIGSLGNRWGRPVTGLRTPIDLRRLDFVRRAPELAVPILILHSSDDDYVPRSASVALALSRPDLVTMPGVSIAGHARLWNYESEAWNSHIGSWLEAQTRRKD